MKVFNKKNLLLTASMYLMSFGLTNAQVSSQKITHDKATGAIELTSPRIAVSPNFTITATKGLTNSNGLENQGIISLKGETQFIIDSQKGTAVGASYNPTNRTLSAKSITIALKKQNKNLLSTVAADSYTCSSGTLYMNGQSTGGNSVCYGYTLIKCGGNGGNEVQIMRLDHECPVE